MESQMLTNHQVYITGKS